MRQRQRESANPIFSSALLNTAYTKDMIRGPGGTITIDAGGVTIEGIAIKLKGPMTQSSGAGNALSISGNPVTGEPICVSCLLKAIAEGRSVIRMQG